MTPIKNRITKENLRRTRGKKIKKINMSETPTTFLPRGKENVSKRKLLFSGKKKGKTPVSSNGENRDQEKAVPMEIDPQSPSGHHCYVKKEGDDTYFSVKVEELTISKISEAVTLKLQLGNGAIGDIKLKDKSMRINVKKDDGSIEERDLKKGDLTLVLKRENVRNYFTLSEH